MAKYIVLLILVFGVSSASFAQFTGELVLEPEGCEEARKCYTKYPLRYIESNGRGWEAKAGLETDGASIPLWAQPFIGNPYDESFLKAAVVHDHYCVRHVRTWRETHKAFYYMLRSLEVPKIKAKIMYYAVFVGGPKWVELVVGNDCGKNCINTFNQHSQSEKIRYETESYYNVEDLDIKLNKMKLLLEKKDLSLEEIEAIAIKDDPSNFYYINGSTYPYDPKIGIDR